MKYKFEYTDTFGGEANYSWVIKDTIEADDARQAITKAKQEVGLTGVVCDIEEYGDMVKLTPHGHATVLFVEEDNQ